MREYIISVPDRVFKSLKKLPKKDQLRILEKIDLLKFYPQTSGLDILKLSGQSDVFRMRVGNYRVIFSIFENTITIEVQEVAHRKDIYKNY